METKTMEGQVLVRYSGKDEAQRLFDLLTRNGYRNVQGLTAETYSFHKHDLHGGGRFEGDPPHRGEGILVFGDASPLITKQEVGSTLPASFALVF